MQPSVAPQPGTGLQPVSVRLEPSAPPAHDAPLSEGEITHLEVVLRRWRAGDVQKEVHVLRILASARKGALSTKITWPHDLPDLHGSRFTVGRVSEARPDDLDARFVERATTDIAARYAQWKTQRKRLSPEKELELIDACLDAHQRAFPGPGSPLPRQMMKLSARACQLIVKLHTLSAKGRLEYKFKKSVFVLQARSKEQAGCEDLVRLDPIGNSRFQLHVRMLTAFAKGPAEVDVDFQGWVEPALEPAAGAQEVQAGHAPTLLSNPELRELFRVEKFERVTWPSRNDTVRSAASEALGRLAATAQPQLDRLREQEAQESQSVVIHVSRSAIHHCIPNLIGGYISGPRVLPSTTDLLAYAELMANLLMHESDGLSDHELVQRAESTIKAYLDYVEAAPFNIDWSKARKCVEAVGAARDKLGGGPFTDADAESAYQQMLRALPPAAAQAEPPAEAA